MLHRRAWLAAAAGFESSQVGQVVQAQRVAVRHHQPLHAPHAADQLVAAGLEQRLELKGGLARDGALFEIRRYVQRQVQRLDVVFSGGSGARGSEGGQGERQRRYGGRQPLAAEAVEQYQTGRLLGYNTMEMVM